MFTVTEHPTTYGGKRKFTVEYDELELASVKLYDWDMAVLNDRVRNVSDIFQNWELLARRYEEQLSKAFADQSIRGSQ